MNNALRKINSILNKSKKREESIFLLNLKSDATIFVTFQRCIFLFLVWINICTNILQIQAEILSLYKKKKKRKKKGEEGCSTIITNINSIKVMV